MNQRLDDMVVSLPIGNYHLELNRNLMPSLVSQTREPYDEVMIPWDGADTLSGCFCKSHCWMGARAVVAVGCIVYTYGLPVDPPSRGRRTRRGLLALRILFSR